MRPPEKATTPSGCRSSRWSLRRPGAARPWRCQSGLHTHLVDAVALGPLRGELLDAGAAAVHQHEVGAGPRVNMEPGDIAGCIAPLHKSTVVIRSR